MDNIDINTFRFSKSSVNELLQCPHKFKLHHIDKFKCDTNYFMERGTQAHKLLIAYNNGTLVESRLRDPDMLKYLNNFKKIQTKYKLGVPAQSDLKMEGIIEGLYFSGEMDAAYSMKIDGTDRYIVIDYKSSSSKADTFKRPESKTPEKLLGPYVFELQIYSYLFQGAIGADIRRYGIIFLGDGYFFHLPVDKEYRVMEATLQEVKRVVSEGKYNPVKNPYCRNCGVNNYCKSYISGIFPEENMENLSPKKEEGIL